MERKAYWYSVIQYSPDVIRGERINIGIILHCPVEGKLFHSLLDDGSRKLKSILLDDSALRVFETQKDLIDFYLKKTMEQRSLIGPDFLDDDFLFDISKSFPEEFQLTEPTFALSSNPNQLFESLLNKYVGDIGNSSKQEFNSLEPVTDSIKNVKIYTRQYFNQRHWIGTKVKTNIKLHPSEDLKSMQFNIDFVFKNGIWNLIQTIPSNSSIDKLTEWFSKTRTFLETYEKKSDLYVIYDNNDQMNGDNTITEMVTYLKKKDSRVSSTEIKSTEFITLCDKVENEAKDISALTDEMIAV